MLKPEAVHHRLETGQFSAFSGEFVQRVARELAGLIHRGSFLALKSRGSRRMQPYTPEELDEALAEFPDWLSTDFAIHRSYSFPSFRAAMAFVNAVADLAEQHNHHPDIEIHFRDVSLSLWTHTVGGVTKRDIVLAQAINALPAHVSG